MLGINSTALARNAVITVPAATIDRVVDAILERGHVPRPFLGAAMQAVPVPEALRSQFGEGVDEALLVLHVEANAPAATAGILVGDLVLSVDGHLVHNVHDVQHRAIQPEGWRSGCCGGYPRRRKNRSEGNSGGSWLRITNATTGNDRCVVLPCVDSMIHAEPIRSSSRCAGVGLAAGRSSLDSAVSRAE